MREVASHIEERGRTDPTSPEVEVPDQIVACLSSRGPDSAAILRYASRLAGRLNRTWYALYVRTPGEAPERVKAETQRMLYDTLTLAHQLGATVETFAGEDVVDAILRFANEYGVGHIVIGRSPPLPWWKRVLGRRTRTRSPHCRGGRQDRRGAGHNERLNLRTMDLAKIVPEERARFRRYSACLEENRRPRAGRAPGAC